MFFVMKEEVKKEFRKSDTFFSKFYQKTDSIAAKVILILGLSAGPIVAFVGYFFVMWGEVAMLWLAIPFTIYAFIALIIISFRLIYPQIDKSRKSFKERLMEISEDELRIKYKRIIILIIIMLIIFLSFLFTGLYFTIGGESAFGLVYGSPIFIPLFFLIIELRQIQLIKSEMYKRGIMKK